MIISWGLDREPSKPSSEWIRSLDESGRAHSGAGGTMASLHMWTGAEQPASCPWRGTHKVLDNVRMRCHFTACKMYQWFPARPVPLDLSSHWSETPQPLEPLHYPTPASWVRDLGTWELWNSPSPTVLVPRHYWAMSSRRLTGILLVIVHTWPRSLGHPQRFWHWWHTSKVMFLGAQKSQLDVGGAEQWGPALWAVSTNERPFRLVASVLHSSWSFPHLHCIPSQRWPSLI